jgi:hypothetical protein
MTSLEIFSPAWNEFKQIQDQMCIKEAYDLWPEATRAAEIDAFKDKLGAVWNERRKYVDDIWQSLKPLVEEIQSELEVS